MRLLLCCFLLFFTAPIWSQVSRISPVETPVFERVSVSMPARSLDNVYTPDESHEAPENESLQIPFPNYETNRRPDGALQGQYGRMLESAGAEVNVLGAFVGFSSDGIEPSDNTMVVGPNHVIQMVNSASTSMRIWDKQGNVLANNINITGIVGTNLGDPNIIYDYEADRYVFLVIGGGLTRANISICVSETNDPLGSWLVYKVRAGGIFSASFPDYPKLSVWGNSYYVTTNASGPFVYAIRRDLMLSGAATTESKLFKLTDFPGGGVQSTSPVTVIGQNPVAENSPAVVMRVFDAAWTANTTDVDVLELYTVQIDWQNAANSFISAPLKLETEEYDFTLCSNDFNGSNCIPQKGVNQRLDAIGSIIYDKAQYRNFGTHESIVCTHVTDARNNGIAGARWYELRRTNANWEIYQEGTFSPDDGTYRFMSSISINDKGTVAIGYNVSSSNIHPDIAFTARNVEDAPGIMSAVETITQFGSGSQTSSNRYGDYNALVCDPVDGSFWFTANYTPGGGRWATSIIHFEVTGGILPVVLTNFKVSNSNNAVTINWTTSSETNNQRFDIERSADGVSFNTIGSIAASTATTGVKNYEFLDRSPLSGTAYYRLKQVDKSGAFSYSSIKQVHFNGRIKLVSMYPNPANAIVNLEFEAGTSTVEKLIITDASGRVVLALPINIVQGSNKTAIPISALSAGQYFVQFKIDGLSQQLKLVVQR